MAQVGNVVVKLSADSAQYRKGIQEAKKANDDFFKTLKGQLGEESKLGNLAKLLAGAGAVAGFTALGNMAGNWAKRVREGVEAFRSGEKSTGEIVEDLAKGAPLIGGWVTAGREIRSLFDDTAAAAKRITDEANRASKHADTIMDRGKRFDTLGESIGKQATDARTGGLDDQSGARARIQAAFDERQKSIDKLREELRYAGENEKRTLTDKINKMVSDSETIRQAEMTALLKQEDAKRVQFEDESNQRINELHSAADRRNALLGGGELIAQLYDIREAFKQKEQIVRDHYEQLKKDIPSEADILRGQLDKELAAVADARKDAEIEASLGDFFGFEKGPDAEQKTAQFSAASEQRFAYLVPGQQAAEDKKVRSTEALTTAVKDNTKAIRDSNKGGSGSTTVIEISG